MTNSISCSFDIFKTILVARGDSRKSEERIAKLVKEEKFQRKKKSPRITPSKEVSSNRNEKRYFPITC